ncbi:NAD(P)/FAD-dependent oxidoreductase [Croceiramulus getboli]|nr:NAD(P)/FAD-dependent oxidoreductase [Flavobacteriaceae bacterium YJPT1-3]
MEYDVLIIGGGAAGFFTALNVAQQRPEWKIAILERGNECLTKVKVSGGGRCNVTHAEFIPKTLSTNYPRGEKELLGPFHSFMTGDTMGWFEERGVELKIEDDGRMFPVTDDSQTIIDCFLREAQQLNIKVALKQAVQQLEPPGGDRPLWTVKTKDQIWKGSQLMLATGSNPKIWKLLEELGHTISPAVPSLFTFNIQDSRIADLPGLATEARVQVLDESGQPTVLEATGPLLITHWGMSGPAILRLSAWGAQTLHMHSYQFDIAVNWLGYIEEEEVALRLREIKQARGKKQVSTEAAFDLPKRLWRNLVRAAQIRTQERWADLTRDQLSALTRELVRGTFRVSGKSTFKEEFVTAGGVALDEIDFRSFSSKLFPQLFFAGEVMNVDAITGGFNFQNAWTGGFIAAQAMAKK